ncbi:zinc-binding dehydrogenase (plasmid) [Glutamicibacter sp. FR1]|uniref:zinc-binding dehydrogenase n=1 Tax=Micrococcaceae TaxID=1268 RepID=UPI0014150ED5|nr:zinc-binding dehydrogenase [Arthrobacter sp. JUb115]
MKALVLAADGLELATIPEPTRETPDAVLVEVTLISLNRGETSLPWRSGQVAGWDAFGTVIETSSDGQGPPVGSTVTTWGYSGAWAQQRVVSRHDLAVVAGNIDPYAAAALPAAGVSALHAVKTAQIVKGTRLAIVGGTGGVGHLATQLAASLGAIVTVVTRDPISASAAHTKSANWNINFTSVEDINPSAEFDAIIDTVGGTPLSLLTEHLARRGRVLLVGAAGGEKTTLDTSQLIKRKASMHSLDVPTPLGNDLSDLLTLVSEEKIRLTASDGGSWVRLIDEPASQLMGMGKSVFHVN